MVFAKLRGLRRALELSVSRPGAVCVGPGSLCVGHQRFLCRASAPYRHSLSGPGALYVPPSHSLRRVGPQRSLGEGPTLSRSLCRARRFLCRVSAVSVSRPSALCVGARRSLCLALVGARRFVCRCTLCVGPRRSLALCVGPIILYVMARCSLCRGVSRPRAL